MRLFSVVCLFALSLPGWATHILGGEMTYTSLGNDNYQVTLRLYRDCGADNTNNTALDATAAIGVFNSSGQWINTVTFQLPSEVNVPVVADNPCLTVPPGICTRMGVYTGVIHLPAGTGGYTLSYQRCCRSPAIVNLNNPGVQGMTCTVQVPDPSVHGPNSSPSFNNNPPMVLCLGQTTVLDQLATDPDGDSLAYHLCAPLQGGDNLLNTVPVPPSAPPYLPVIWGNGYSTQYQVSSQPPMSFAELDGQLTLHPTALGNYAVSICVGEYRNGALLSTVIRDFRFLVVACIQDIVASFPAQAEGCNGLHVQMANQSTGATSYHWDFGVPGTDSDTSAEANPAFTYPAPGNYTITLVANPGWPCGDTAQHVYTVHDPLNASFSVPGILCTDQLPLHITATGNFTPAAQITWDVGPGVSPDLHAPDLTVGWSTLGPHPVTLFVEDYGCEASFSDTVTVHPPPQPLFSLDTNGCEPFTAQPANLSSAWSPMQFLWEFGDGGTSTDSLPAHTFTQPGKYGIRLTATTTSGCIATRTWQTPDTLTVWPRPTAQATALPKVTTVLAPEVAFHDHSSNAAEIDFLVEGAHYNIPDFTHTFSDAGWYTALLKVTSPHGCTDTTSLRIFIGDHLFFAPTAFTPDGDGHNEIWRPSVKGARAYRLEVFDRWGRVVFSTTDPEAGWNGKDAAPGIYAYKAWLTEWGPLEKEYNGSFVLIK